MTVRSKFALGLAAAALVIGSVSPAAARGYDGRWRHRHDNGPSAGTVFGLLLGVGVIAAIASANNRKQQEAEGRRDYDPRPQDRAYEGDRSYDNRSAEDRRYDDGRATNASEDQAVDACAIAARDEASRSGDFAEVRDITGVQPYGTGYDVTGTLTQRSGYRASDNRLRSFRCMFENDQVSGVTFNSGI